MKKLYLENSILWIENNNDNLTFYSDIEMLNMQVYLWKDNQEKELLKDYSSFFGGEKTVYNLNEMYFINSLIYTKETLKNEEVNSESFTIENRCKNYLNQRVHGMVTSIINNHFKLLTERYKDSKEVKTVASLLDKTSLYRAVYCCYTFEDMCSRKYEKDHSALQYYLHSEGQLKMPIWF